ncbi:type IV-A pilus assembly ATPase PilB [Vibrio hangzhouensis]|uniref:type IV-A pilus assembly ATPase PilB n=1 Tax=Vibrio hangzhouensis TaxID=462991 RepID=UPI001C961F94|nr:type IV-A pilus assembly ATPase PilB [Vibrio hangzhouensis]MBY6199479.1 type IV-A pilus assembly ATPase PilB [Vibrio hangzhouensis]
MNLSLTSILQRANLITSKQGEYLEQWVTSSGLSNPEGVVHFGWQNAQTLTERLSQLLGLPTKCLQNYQFQDLCQSLAVRELILTYHALPIEKRDDILLIAVADPTLPQIENDFRFATGRQIELVLGNCLDIRAAIRRMYGDKTADFQEHSRELTSDELATLVQVSDIEVDNIEDLSLDDSPVSRFIHQVLLDAVRKKASDIHFEPYEHSYRIRLRCDGILIETQQPANQLSRRLAARIKILARLDIAERRLPQDGRLKLRLSETASIDMRVSTLPTMWGEKIVLRLLDGGASSLAIDQLGYSEWQKSQYLDALRKPQGMILMTGPTGSGKTVSLYAGLNILNTPQRNISTAEDPVEIHLEGVNQLQINPKIGLDFSTALRSFLRQDPDVVMLGEIRDIETAEIAIKAAQTGHLVMSTLHTNSAAETITRLRNMGIDGVNLGSSLSLIIAQRLARCLCPTCKQVDRTANQRITALVSDDTSTIFEANSKGCNECNQGYLGRTGIYEVMPFTDELTQAVMQQASMAEIQAIAKSQGMITLRQSGFEKLRQGITSYEELQRVLYF